MRLFLCCKTGIVVILLSEGEVCDAGGKKLIFLVCRYEIIEGQITGSVIHVYDKGSQPLVRLRDCRDPSADVHFKPAKRSIAIAHKPPGPFAGNLDLKVQSRLVYGCVESEPPDAGISAGKQDVIIILNGNSHPSLTTIINIA
jgi:hypothetical protein